ncbi:hypothetical protein HMPREF0308_1722 [Corynebacterium striatum ATCC 6940]|nr:hypothetical protein HMPREF0308_1722 [Corynebacterium striatum ATCC 6940]
MWAILEAAAVIVALLICGRWKLSRDDKVEPEGPAPESATGR